MPMNRVQFQPGLSMAEFQEQFGTRGDRTFRAFCCAAAQKVHRQQALAFRLPRSAGHMHK